MVSIASLWLPIIVSTVIVFIVSSLIHTVFGYHDSDFKKVGDEDGLRDAFSKFNIPPGDYVVPNASSHKNAGTPEFKEKWKKGPVWIMTVIPNSEMKMGGSLTQWFVFCLVVGVFAAYISGHALSFGANYLSVFRFAGSTAFASYSLAVIPQSIWFKISWKTTFKNVFDGLVYALLTAGVFGWLWPTGM